MALALAAVEVVGVPNMAAGEGPLLEELEMAEVPPGHFAHLPQLLSDYPLTPKCYNSGQKGCHLGHPKPAAPVRTFATTEVARRIRHCMTATSQIRWGLSADYAAARRPFPRSPKQDCQDGHRCRRFQRERLTRWRSFGNAVDRGNRQH